MSATQSKIPRPSNEELRRLYIDEQLGCPEIGRRFQRDEKTVFWWLRQAGIPTRPRGSDPRQHFAKGHAEFAGHRHSPASIAKIKAASVARGAIPYLKNGKHWLKDAPPEMNPRWLGGATPERQAFYRSQEWKEACRAVWRRADAKCERCGLDHRTIDRERLRFHVHHIVSFQVRELRAEVTNLVLLCQPCHSWVHGKQNVGRQFIAKVQGENGERLAKENG